jgi:mannose-6-phosphate isomerase-like protein (cupin superfamily)
MKAVKVSEVLDKPNPHGVSAKKIYDSEHAQVIHMTLKPGESLKKHVTPVDVFFYILEGEGQVEIGDEVQTVKKDTIIDSPAKIPHRLMNPGKGDFRYLVVKVPRPAEKPTLKQNP